MLMPAISDAVGVWPVRLIRIGTPRATQVIINCIKVNHAAARPTSPRSGEVAAAAIQKANPATDTNPSEPTAQTEPRFSCAVLFDRSVGSVKPGSRLNNFKTWSPSDYGRLSQGTGIAGTFQC